MVRWWGYVRPKLVEVRQRLLGEPEVEEPTYTVDRARCVRWGLFPRDRAVTEDPVVGTTMLSCYPSMRK